MVGWFVGYSPAQGKKTTVLTKSRNDQCEWGLSWDMVPPLCRPDNIEEKNKEIQQRQQGRSSQDELVEAHRQHAPIQSSNSQDEDLE